MSFSLEIEICKGRNSKYWFISRRGESFIHYYFLCDKKCMWSLAENKRFIWIYSLLFFGILHIREKKGVKCWFNRQIFANLKVLENFLAMYEKFCIEIISKIVYSVFLCTSQWFCKNKYASTGSQNAKLCVCIIFIKRVKVPSRARLYTLALSSQTIR